MSTVQIAFLALIFLSVFAFVIVGMTWLSPNAARRRLRAFVPVSSGQTSLGTQDPAWMERAAQITARFGKLSLPEEGWEASGMRRRFMNAGIRSASAPGL